MKWTTEKKVGVFFVIAIVILAVLLERTKGGELFVKKFVVKTYFGTASGLKVGDAVKLAGVEVGKVSAIGIAQDKVEVQMSIRSGSPVRTDSVASIKMVSLLGATFLDLTLGKPQSPLVPAGGVVSSEEPMDMASFLAKADKIADAFRGVSDVFGENRETLRSTIKRLDSVLGKVEKGEGTLGKLVTDDSLFKDARSAFADIRKVTDKVNRGEGTLGKLVTDDSLFKDAKNALSDIRKVADKVNRGEGTLGKLVQDDSLFKDAKNALSDIRKVTDKVNRGEGTLGKLVQDDSLFKDARSALNEARTTFTDMRKVTDKINRGEGTLGKLVTDDSFYKEAKNTVTNLGNIADKINKGQGTIGKLVNEDGVYGDIKGSANSLNNILKKLDRGEGTLGKLVREDELYFRARDALKRVDKAAQGLEEQGPLSVIGLALGVLLF